MSVLKDNERGHRKQFVNFARDIGECRAGVGIAFECDSEKEIGVIDGVINALVFMESYRLLGVVSDLVSGELEEEVCGLPFVEQRLF